MFGRLLRAVVAFAVVSFFVGKLNSAYADENQSLCGPALGGGILNFAWECWNDAVFLRSQPERRDSSDWEYVDDTLSDGSGGSHWDIHGIAFKESSDKVCVALNTELDFTTGYQNSDALNGEVTYGDLFFNYSGLNFKDASDQAQLYAVRFDDKNDSGTPELGLYKNVTAMSVATLNLGRPTRLHYENYLFSHGGVVAGYGDYDKNMTYFAEDIALNVIASGQKIGDIELKTPGGLVAMGYSPNRFTGPFTVGFCFNKSLIVDQCGVFGGDGTSCLDCSGVACGTKVLDQCLVCDGDGQSCLDCAGTPFGEQTLDICGVCGGDGTTCLDCRGNPFGEEQLDQCGVCGGDGTSCLDCSGTVNGTQTLDICGVCGGDGTSCRDCAGNPFGQAQLDRCGVCSGDGTSCLGCESIDSTKDLFALDSGSAAQAHTLKSALKKLSKFAGNSKSLRRYIAAELKAADKLHTGNWTLSWTIPQITVQCANTAFCVNVDNVSVLTEYRTNALSLYNKTRTALKKLKAASNGKVNTSALGKKAKQTLDQVLDFSAQIPAVRSLCNEGGPVS